jgi:hypothetical protein
MMTKRPWNEVTFIGYDNSDPPQLWAWTGDNDDGAEPLFRVRDVEVVEMHNAMWAEITRLTSENKQLASRLDALTRDKITAEREVERLIAEREELANDLHDATVDRDQEMALRDKAEAEITRLIAENNQKMEARFDLEVKIARLTAERDVLTNRIAIAEEFVLACDQEKLCEYGSTHGFIICDEYPHLLHHCGRRCLELMRASNASMEKQS